MVRGRSKAKQTKVAPDLKYSPQEMDLDRLAKEFHGEPDKWKDRDDDDPCVEGNYMTRAEQILALCRVIFPESPAFRPDGRHVLDIDERRYFST